MNKKTAFTFGEVLITLFIVGLISVFAIRTIQQVGKNVKYIYSNTYHSLDKALYNASYYANLPDPFADATAEELDGAARATRMCMFLTEYINYSQRNCAAPPVTDSGELNNASPHFVSQNGVKFYISSMFPNIVDDDNPHTFFIVYADVNGDKKPNSMKYEPSNPNQDIFAFAALDIRRVCPLGSPEIESKFMTTRIAYYVEENEHVVEKFSTTSKPYNISKAEAWGYYLNQDELDDDFYIEDNPLSYNGYVKRNISDTSLIYSFLNDNNISLTVPAAVTLKSQPAEENGYGCVKGSDAECDIIIDKYLY